MTNESLERGKNIKSEIDDLNELIDNIKHIDRSEPFEFVYYYESDARGCQYSDSVDLHSVLSNTMISKVEKGIIKILEDRVEELKEEFENL